MLRGSPWLPLTSIAIVLASIACAQTDYEMIGVNPLRREQPSLTGAGIPVGQSEGQEATNRWEVNPAAVSQPVSLFTWISADGTATTFPNSAGLESGHANFVASIFYGSGALGIAPGVQHVRNYEANSYVQSVITPKLAQPDVIVNQSWISSLSSTLDDDYDQYAAAFNVLFVSGMNNATDTPPSPGSAYNGIGVGGSDVPSSVGPTANGRAKPDITVPGLLATSFLTPAVAGSAALLWQAAARNDGGPATAVVATNSTVIKALLLNGAIKRPGWTNGPTRPLDARYGAGDLNVYNSWLQLRGGRAVVNVTNSSLRGWVFESLNGGVFDQTQQYHFNLSTNGSFVANVTLVWKRPLTPALPNFDLLLIDSNNQAVASSVSTVDNVEHLFATNLPPGRYSVRVVRRGGDLGSQSYALAFDFMAPRLQVARVATNVVVSWPVNEAGFVLQSAPNLDSPIQWQNVGTAPFITNGMNTVTVAAGQPMASFRLFRP